MDKLKIEKKEIFIEYRILSYNFTVRLTAFTLVF
jgi:hypothetical protein